MYSDLNQKWACSIPAGRGFMLTLPLIVETAENTWGGGEQGCWEAKSFFIHKLEQQTAICRI